MRQLCRKASSRAAIAARAFLGIQRKRKGTKLSTKTHLDRCAAVGRVQRGDLLVAELAHRAQHDRQVAAHVGVGAVVYIDVWHLCKRLQCSRHVESDIIIGQKSFINACDGMALTEALSGAHLQVLSA